MSMVSDREMINFELLGSLNNLKRIRLERIFIPSFVILKNFIKLSMYIVIIQDKLSKTVT